jgi:hypothetical protein
VRWCALNSFDARVLRVRSDVWQAAFGDRMLPPGTTLESFSAAELHDATV